MLNTLLPTLESQLTAIHSLQVFCLSLNFPKGMLLRWFNALYDFSIIDDEAFLKWREDVNDAYPGKGEALFQVIYEALQLIVIKNISLTLSLFLSRHVRHMSSIIIFVFIITGEQLVNVVRRSSVNRRRG